MVQLRGGQNPFVTGSELWCCAAMNDPVEHALGLDAPIALAESGSLIASVHCQLHSALLPCQRQAVDQ
jgi:hypothetical protein